MAKRIMTPADWLTLVAERAGALRAAGVESVELDGCSIKLAPYERPSIAPPQLDTEETEHPDPLFDRATYTGGQVPGFDLDAMEPDDGDVEGRS